MPITHENLTSFLSEHLHASISSIEPVSMGAWSQTFFFTAGSAAGSARKVIRFSAFDEDFKNDRYAARFSTPNLPVPRIEEIGEAFGLFFAISPRIDGGMIDHLDAEGMRAILPALLDLLNALREADGSQTHGYGGFDGDGNAGAATWQEYLTGFTPDDPDSRLKGWKKNLAGYAGAEALYQAGLAQFYDLLPFCPEERHLIHNDLLHFNVLVKDNRVAGVIDWGCGMWGDFLYDLAMITSWQFYYPAMTGIDYVEAARAYFINKGVSLPHYYERIQCYQIHLLLDSLAYNAWKEDAENLALTARRLEEVLGQ